MNNKDHFIIGNLVFWQ